MKIPVLLKEMQGDTLEENVNALRREKEAEKLGVDGNSRQDFMHQLQSEPRYFYTGSVAPGVGSLQSFVNTNGPPTISGLRAGAGAGGVPTVSPHHQYIFVRDSDERRQSHNSLEGLSLILDNSFLQSNTDDMKRDERSQFSALGLDVSESNRSSHSLNKMSEYFDRLEGSRGFIPSNDLNSSQRSMSEMSDANKLVDSINRLNEVLENKERDEINSQNSKRYMPLGKDTQRLQQLDNSNRSESDSSDTNDLLLSLHELNEVLRRSREDKHRRYSVSFMPKPMKNKTNGSERREPYRKSRSLEGISKQKSKSNQLYKFIRKDLGSLYENDNESFGSISSCEEDEEIAMSCSLMDMGTKPGEHTQQSSHYRNSTKSRRSHSSKIGTLGNCEIIDVVAPSGVLGLVLESPDGGWPVVRVVKENSVVSEHVDVGDRIMSIDGEDIRNLTIFKSSSILNSYSEESRMLTVLKASGPNKTID
eukprot:CAMPEP_0171449360 /NCGR_PEP_ID=MMETSP0881-20121228/40081_1 /TAXON_ID=67004 /ORGANISM="Thalassiosira weissflogii, Strain CCMP1336" /LENGTH=476 /DNA_ID=CAMNT_0011973799 /DNA_START=629 /DNA_END=2060 /DNA_ORIENTATION=-